MIPQYKFTINNGTGQRAAYPIWKDDMSLEYAYESNQKFRRGKLSGNITFVGSDYDYIMAASFEQTYTLLIQVSYDNGGYWQEFFNGVFHITDCTVNVDDKSITVKPEVNDKYSKILAGLDKEYDLIKLAPAIQPVTMTRRPMIQIYVKGDTIVNCFLSGMTWEQDMGEVEHDIYMTEHFHFGIIGEKVEIKFTGSHPAGLDNVFTGTVVLDQWVTFENGQRTYSIQVLKQSYAMTEYRYSVRVYSYQNFNTILWECDTAVLGEGMRFESQRSGVADLTADGAGFDVYGRIMLAKDWFNASQAYEVRDDDPVTYNRNYRYCVPLNLTDAVTMSYLSSSDPTEWGIRPDGEYYVKPSPTIINLNYFPVGQSVWRYGSMWFCQTTALNTLEEYGRKETQLRDAYTLEAVIGALLAEIDPEITFYSSQVYSRFLFGSNPLFEGWGRLVMTPKSNVLVAEYTQPARKAPITLGKVLNMLRDVCGCYWYLNDNKQLIVEHISWFKNGGSYSGTHAIGIDITTAENTRNGKMLSFGTNEYSFEKTEMPERYQYEWMDDTTETFKGQAIDVLSAYVDQGNIEEVTVDGFNADLDYMMLNPSNVSEDGFALLCCQVVSGNYSTQISTQATLRIQNWQLAMINLQPAFLISDMPAWAIKVNGLQGTAKGIQRKKTQTVNIPVGYITPNMQTLIKTGIGTGEIKSMSIKLTSRMAKTTIIYDTTQQ